MTETGPRALRRRVLIVEDEAPIRELMRLHLGLAGFDVVECANGTLALERARAEKFDLILLDVMLPGLDGITVCRAIRNQGVNTNTAILMVTARDTESDTVLGLESGADDYLAKPFGVRELVARTAALLRRTGRQDSASAASTQGVESGDLALDADRREAVVRGTPVELTKQEFDLLLSARLAPRHRVQPDGAPRESLARRHLRDRAHGGHRGQPAAPEDRARSSGSRIDPHRVGRRLQVRRC